MTATFRHQTALITGAASGLGLAIARRLSFEGVRLALLDRNSAQLNDLRPAFGPDCGTYVTDITKEEEVKTTVEEIAGRYGRILHIASIAGKEGNAGMLAYIVSPENSYSTGFTFDLSGGRATY